MTSLTIEDTLHIDVEDVVPTFLFRKIKERPSPGDARVVHEDVKFGFALPKFADESITPCPTLTSTVNVAMTTIIVWLSHPNIRCDVMYFSRGCLVDLVGGLNTPPLS